MKELGGFEKAAAGPLSRLVPRETVRRITAALAAGGGAGLPPWPGPGAGWVSGNGFFRLVPVWTGEVGAVVPAAQPGRTVEGDQAEGSEAPEEVWLWGEPGFLADLPGLPSQWVLDLPPGRYTVAAWDVKAGRLVENETVAGETVSFAPPFAGGALIIALRREE